MFLLPETRNCDNFLQKSEKLIHIFKTFGIRSRKLLHWKNIDQLCMKDHVAFVEEKLGRGLWVIHVPPVSPLTL